MEASWPGRLARWQRPSAPSPAASTGDPAQGSPPAGRDFRKATMATRSSSLRFWYDINGNAARLSALTPCRSIRATCASVRRPMPVAASGVRFAEKKITGRQPEDVVARQRQLRAFGERRPSFSRHMAIRARRGTVDEIAAALDRRRIADERQRRQRDVERAFPSQLDRRERTTGERHQHTDQSQKPSLQSSHLDRSFTMRA